jgi:hypothetical protein
VLTPTPTPGPTTTDDSDNNNNNNGDDGNEEEDGEDEGNANASAANTYHTMTAPLPPPLLEHDMRFFFPFYTHVQPREPLLAGWLSFSFFFHLFITGTILLL